MYNEKKNICNYVVGGIYMKKFIYEFNKPIDEVIKGINAEIENNDFTGNVYGRHIELRCICDGYRHSTTYQLTADIEETNDGKCTLAGCFKYKSLWLIMTLVLVVLMFGYSSFMATAYTSNVGKYLLVFSVIISIAYLYMSFSKRKDVISQTKRLFDKINGIG